MDGTRRHSIALSGDRLLCRRRRRRPVSRPKGWPFLGTAPFAPSARHVDALDSLLRASLGVSQETTALTRTLPSSTDYSSDSLFSRKPQNTMPAAAPRKAAAKAAKKKTSKFTIDCTKPVEDKIMDVRLRWRERRGAKLPAAAARTSLRLQPASTSKGSHAVDPPLHTLHPDPHRSPPSRSS